MSVLCDSPWNDYIIQDQSLAGFGVVAAVRYYKLSGLKVSHAILGLYQTAIGVLQQPLLYSASAEMWSWHYRLGRVELYSQNRLPPYETILATNFTADPTSDAGTIEDLNYPEYTIDYQFDGVKINSKLVFAAIIDALTTAAPFDSDSKIDRFEGIEKVTGTGQVVLGVHAAHSTDPISYSIARSAVLSLFSRVIFDQNRWQEMSFTVMKDGEKAGGGGLVRLGQSMQGTLSTVA